jgi:hypothetical protein
MSVPPVPAAEVVDLSGLPRASHDELFDGMRRWATQVRHAESVVAAIAGEIDRRSQRDAGYHGLAAATGARGPEQLVSQLTGRSARDARDLVTAGRLLDAPPVWLTDVASGVSDGTVSVGAAAAIVSGLGTPSPSLGADDLLDAAQTLLAEVGTLPPEKVAKRARELRDEMDAAGVADRERAMYEKRFLRLTLQSDGMTRLFGMLDPESAALVTDAIDCVTAPRRGGPRFVDAAELARVAELERDPRTTEQIALDALVEMVRIAGSADQGRVFGVRKPAVRVHVEGRDLTLREGGGQLEGQTAAVSIATVERTICAGGYLPIVFQSDGKLDVGHAQRLFTERQRVALAAIWGGCAHPDCDRPPSWTEAHHAIPWKKNGPTDVSNGILLCRFHHMWVHNRGYTIRPPDLVPTPQRGQPGTRWLGTQWLGTRWLGTQWLGTRWLGTRWLMIPPPGDGVVREPIRLISKSSLRRNR